MEEGGGIEPLTIPGYYSFQDYVGSQPQHLPYSIASRASTPCHSLTYTFRRWIGSPCSIRTNILWFKAICPTVRRRENEIWYFLKDLNLCQSLIRGRCYRYTKEALLPLLKFCLAVKYCKLFSTCNPDTNSPFKGSI